MNIAQRTRVSPLNTECPVQTCASYDRKHWFRVPTAYDSHHGVLLIKHKPERVGGGPCLDTPASRCLIA